MGRHTLKIVPIAPRQKPTLHFSNASALPYSEQQKLSTLIRRFDQMVLARPHRIHALLVMADQLLRVFDA